MGSKYLRLLLLFICVGLRCCHEADDRSDSQISLNSLASFAKRFWTTMANVVASESRLKRDNVHDNDTDIATATVPPATTTSAPPPRPRPRVAAVPSFSSSSPPSPTKRLTSRLIEMLTEFEEASTGRSANEAEKSETIIHHESATHLSNSGDVPLAWLSHSKTNFTDLEPSKPLLKNRSELRTAPNIDFGRSRTTSVCNDTTHAHPDTTDDGQVRLASTLQNPKDIMEEIIAITQASLASLSSSAPATTAKAPTRTKTTTDPETATTTPVTTVLSTTFHPPTTAKSVPASPMAELLNMTAIPATNETLTVASLVKAISTAMAIVSEHLGNAITNGSSTEEVTPGVTGTEATHTTPQELSRAPLLNRLPSEINIVSSSKRVRVPPVTAFSSTRSTLTSRIPPVLVLDPKDDPREDDFDQRESQDEFVEAFNDALEDKFETAELIQDDDIKSLKKKPNDPNGFFIRLPVKNTTEEPGECFFNISNQQALCNWKFASQSSIKWSFGFGETAFMNGGPVTDSNGLASGGYAFIDTSAGVLGTTMEIQRASLESPKLPKTHPSGRCFTFWYNIGGLSSDRLRVLLVPEEDYSDPNFVTRLPSFSILWERKDSTNSTWMKGEILYTFSKPHRLIFEGFARSGNDPRRKFQGFVAVDDFAMDSESCDAFCTFEGIPCDWENEEDEDDFDWQLGRGSLSHLTGPVRDHGDGPEGGYMYIDSAYPRRPGDIARLVSSELPATVDGPVCFKFWTHMYGNGIGTLKVLLKQGDNDQKLIWEVSGESGNSWHMAQVTVSSSTDYEILMEGVVGKNSLGSIAIDDISFGPGPCPSSPQSALPSRGDCTFESDECGWINAGSGDQYDWLRTSSGQPLLPGQGPNSGYRPPEPLADHSTGISSGFFLTMERSTIPPRSGEQAYIVGPTLQGSAEGKCFSFWGYMHERSVDASGPGLGSLRIYLRIGTSSILRPIWRLINYEYPDWFFAQTPIQTAEKFQIVIGGTWGSTRQGAISVDDFTFYDGNCSVLPVEAEVTPGECTFDSNMCEWTNSLNTTKDRTTWQLATNIRRPSNLDDHTYRASAGYVFFDIFSQIPNIVKLESPELLVDNTTDFDEPLRCLTFWFAPFGSSRNTFLRIIQKDVETNNETQVWEMTTANMQIFKPEWMYGQVPLGSNFTHKIIFEGSSNNGGFALDDIMFIPGNCQPRPHLL